MGCVGQEGDGWSRRDGRVSGWGRRRDGRVSGWGGSLSGWVWWDGRVNEWDVWDRRVMGGAGGMGE